MHLLDITQTNDLIGGIGAMITATAGGCGAGYFLIYLFDRYIPNRKEENSIEDQGLEIQKKQSEFLSDVNKQLNDVVKELQEISCYRVPCDIRINGKKQLKKKQPEKDVKI